MLVNVMSRPLQGEAWMMATTIARWEMFAFHRRNFVRANVNRVMDDTVNSRFRNFVFRLENIRHKTSPSLPLPSNRGDEDALTVGQFDVHDAHVAVRPVPQRHPSFAGLRKAPAFAPPVDGVSGQEITLRHHFVSCQPRFAWRLDQRDDGAEVSRRDVAALSLASPARSFPR